MTDIADFLRFLDDASLVNISVIEDDSHQGLVNRIKAQKLTYFAQSVYNLTFVNEIGEEYTYNFSAYRYGPYSPDLARDYYEVSGDELAYAEYDFPFAEDFVNTFNGKDEKWLEIAATLYDNLEGNTTEETIAIVNKMKPRYTLEQIRQVYNELVNTGIITESQ